MNKQDMIEKARRAVEFKARKNEKRREYRASGKWKVAAERKKKAVEELLFGSPMLQAEYEAKKQLAKAKRRARYLASLEGKPVVVRVPMTAEEKKEKQRQYAYAYRRTEKGRAARAAEMRRYRAKKKLQGLT